MFTFERYTPERKKEWDTFVDEARNATFLFHRNYMDYHANRFADWSVMIFHGKKLYALLPAHHRNNTFFSHMGLTYGGLVVDHQSTAARTLTLFDELNDFLRQAGFRHVLYKTIPHIYHKQPAEEDLYAMFWQCKAQLYTRNIGTAIPLQQPLPWRKDHRRRLALAHRMGIRIKADDDISRFWPILEANLDKRFNATPVHTLSEMLLLKSRFPQNIVLYGAYCGEEMVGGLLFYITPQVLHGQYSATNDMGKTCGAMEAIYEQAIKDYPNMLYLDFGSSTEQQNSQLNEGLIDHKEGYGGRAVCYDTYEWNL